MQYAINDSPANKLAEINNQDSMTVEKFGDLMTRGVCVTRLSNMCNARLYVFLANCKAVR